MRVLIAPDTLKGSLKASDAAQAIKAGLCAGFPNIDCISIPMSDGGEGFLNTLALIFPTMEKKSITITGPYGKPQLAYYGMVKSENLAIVEWAQAAGLESLTPTMPNTPQLLSASSLGVGQIIQRAAQEGAVRLMLGLGGSATCDGGIGALSVLGFRFLNRNKQSISLDAKGLLDLMEIGESPQALYRQFKEIWLLHDVRNPLTGKQGAVVYAKQKGARTAADRRMIQQAFTQYAHVLEKHCNKSLQTLPGTGSAGGAGAGFYALVKAKLVPGADWILQQLHMAQQIQSVDCVIVAEGSLDTQSLAGKAPCKIAHLAKQYGKPVIALVGKNTLTSNQLEAAGITAAFSLSNGPMSTKTALRQANIQLERLSQQLGRCLCALRKI